MQVSILDQNKILYFKGLIRVQTTSTFLTLLKHVISDADI